jgi:hypothetical protein
MQDSFHNQSFFYEVHFLKSNFYDVIIDFLIDFLSKKRFISSFWRDYTGGGLFFDFILVNNF